MSVDSSTVRATVVQASTIFYDTPATLGNISCLCVCKLASLFVIMHALLLLLCSKDQIFRNGL